MKRFLKTIFMLLRVLYRSDRAPKVLFYHDIGTKNTPMGTREDMFIAHMQYLTDVSCPRSDLVHQIAFDDGFRGVWDHRELLRNMGVRPMVFVAIRLIGQPGYLTWEEIRTLQDDYGFRFECHTWSHQTLTGKMIGESPMEERTEQWYRRELIESKVELERQLGREVTALCFPVGNFSDDVIRRCREAGYRKVFASYPGNITDSYVQPRNIVQDSCLLEFKLVLSGGLMAFYKRYYKMHKVVQ